MFLTFQVCKTFVNKQDVIHFICTVRKSNVFYSACGSSCLWEYFKTIQKLIPAYNFCRRIQTVVMVPSSKEQIGLVLQLRDKKHASYHLMQAETQNTSECAVTALQGD